MVQPRLYLAIFRAVKQDFAFFVMMNNHRATERNTSVLAVLPWFDNGLS